jgi:phage tail sheath protein FI
MPAAFLHGIEIIETTIGPIPVSIVRSGVIGLVGTAPVWGGTTRPAWYNAPENAVVPAWTYGDGAKSAFPLWNASAPYNANECVIDSNGNVQQCTVAGTSDAAAPTWATAIGDTTTDSTVTWTLVQKAPTFGRVNALQIVNGTASGAGFGPKVRGYTIPYALRAIALQGGAQVIVVNVFDPNKHVTAVSGESSRRTRPTRSRSITWASRTSLWMAPRSARTSSSTR